MRGAALRAAVVAAAALLAAPSAMAGPGGVPERTAAPAPSAAVIVDGPTRLSAEKLLGTKGAAALTPNCGVCLTVCWGATVRKGSADWSGSVFIYQHLNWCGNGTAVTWASASQSYSQDGWYRLNGGYGPWFSGGCVGCRTIRVSGYILWEWNTPLVSMHTTGTTYLDTTLYSHGAVTAS